MRHHPAEGSSPSRAHSLVVAAALAFGLFAPRGGAQVDFSVTRIELNQAVQAGTTQMVAGRATFVRISVGAQNLPPTTVSIDGLLRVYVGGVETSFSPVFSDNGPFPVAALPNPAFEDGTLNFVFLPPESSDVVLTIEVNPAGPYFVPEANLVNNFATRGPLTFEALRVPELAYAPIDYRPSGGPVPNLPDPALIEPGVGDNFVQGIYPAPDWYYHRTDAPSKLWTSSLSGTGSTLLSSLEVDLALMVPQPDFLYAWVPGGLPYNGQAIIGGQVSMGNTELIRFQRTFAHELGHNHGLFHNTLATGLIGVDVEHHLNITQGLPQIKASTLKDIMYAGLLTHEAWVAAASYHSFLNHPVYDPGSDEGPASDAPILLVVGQWNTATGSSALSHVLTLPSGRLTPAAAPGDADLLLSAYSGGSQVLALPLATATSTDECPACRPDADSTLPLSPLVGFTARIPAAVAGAVIDRIVLTPAGALPFEPLVRERSTTAPQVAFLDPAAGSLVGSSLSVSWTGTDADGDVLAYYLRYSPDGTRRVPLATGVSATSLLVDLAPLPALVDGFGFFELLASDGLRTTVVRTEPLRRSQAWLGTAGNPPWVEILSPDDGTDVWRGATVILHSSGWDLEDRGLDGSSLQWTSDLDGALGQGRLLSVADLSAGTHVLTVTATDAGGLETSDSATLIVVDRELPDTGSEVLCQQDLGFGGPGSATFSLCGGDLSSGTVADLSLVDAPPSTLALLFLSLTFGPTPAEGGTLVPVPVDALLLFLTDGDGSLSLLGVPGGGGPLTVYAQFVLDDPRQPFGYGFSNALQIEFLP